MSLYATCHNPWRRCFGSLGLAWAIGAMGLLGSPLCGAEATLQYPVERFGVLYGRPHPASPPLDDLQHLTVELVRSGNMLASGETGTVESVKLSTPLPSGTVITEDGLKKVLAAVVARVNAGGIYGVVAFPSREQIDPRTHEDLRPATDRSLNIIVWLTEVAEVRTMAKGDHIDAETAAMNPAHDRIRRNSPLVARTDSTPGSLIEKQLLDEYLRRLNRHPGRSVEAALSSTDQTGRVVLDYLVSENRPWFVYGQVSNTGTKATNEWRERIGYVNNQLTGGDDILALDVITSAFDEANAAFASYEIPILFPDQLRAKVHGSWGDFDASLRSAFVTAVAGTDRFTGENWILGTELITSPVVAWGIPIDVAAGLSYQRYKIANETTLQSGDVGFVAPTVSARTEYRSAVVSFYGSLGYETNVRDTTKADRTLLGRFDTRDQYNMIRGELSGSVFLEPLLWGVLERDQWRRATLAHELFLQLRGQYVFSNDRVIPQKEYSVGGMFSARGYEESVVAGDNAIVANLEYRFHLPRALRPYSVKEGETGAPSMQEPVPSLFGKAFNVRPPRLYARPDWDFILRAFVDVAGTEVNTGTRQRRDEDRNHTLASVGLGVEVQLRNNLNVRADWGYVLEDLRTGVRPSGFTQYLAGPNDTDSGSSRLHLLVTLVW